MSWGPREGFEKEKKKNGLKVMRAKGKTAAEPISIYE